MIGRTPGRMRLCTVLLILNLVFIWGNSMLPFSVSSALSQWVKDLIRLFPPGNGEGSQGHGLLRKVAHFCEFCMLGFLFAWLYGMQWKTWSSVALLSIGCASATACLDEVIQIFSPGRNPNILDVGLDTAGAAAGVAVLWAGYIIYQKKKMKNIVTGGKL